MHTQLITLLKQMNKLEVIYLAQDEKRSKRGVKIDQVSVASNKKHYFLRAFNRRFKINHMFTLMPVISNEQVVG